MVLKKSNSGLNSGGSQHVSRGGFLNFVNRKRLPRGASGAVEISLDLATVAHADGLEICLNQINDYLGWHGPRLSHLFDKHIDLRRQHHSRWSKISSYSLNKGHNWDLSAKMDDFMKDADFLMRLSSAVQISFNKISEHLSLSTALSKTTMNTITTTQVLRNRVVQKKNVETKSGQAQVKSKTRQARHWRGVQRWRCDNRINHSADCKTFETEENNKPQKSVVKFTFREPSRVDVRTSNLTQREFQYAPIQSRRGKGYIKNLRAPRKKHSNGIHKEALNAFRDIENLMLNSEVEETKDNDQNVSFKQSGFFLLDFVSPDKEFKRKRKERKKKRDFSSESCWHTCQKHCYPKGSYLYIPSPLNLSANSNPHEETSAHVSVEDTGQEIQIDTTPEKSRRLETQFERREKARKEEVHVFEKSFFPVRVSNERGLSCPDFLSSLNLEENPNVMVGNSFPPCLSISPECIEDKSYVVVCSANTNGTIWHFSLQTNRDGNPKANFDLKVSELYELGQQIALTHLIKLAEDLFKENVVSCKCTPKDESLNILSSNKSNRFTWQESAGRDKLAPEFSILTTDEAMRIAMPSLNTFNPSNSDWEADGITTASFQCGVCFNKCHIYDHNDNESAMMLLPCKHVYCVPCWQAHAYHSIRNGVLSIECMTYGCKVEPNDATLKTLLPYSVIASWRTKLMGRCLDTSKYSSWCPANMCGKVALSTSTPLKTQFGLPLVCVCQRRWCSNCHDTPHWPASCGQMAVYKKLLLKTGDGFLTAQAKATLSVDIKKCPKCSYPIEKDRGCPHMVCGLCWFSFCWNCLQSTDHHNVSRCM